VLRREARHDDELMDDCLALDDLRRSPSIMTETYSLNVSASTACSFFGCGRGIAGLPFRKRV
jgi:hypothetical protein